MTKSERKRLFIYQNFLYREIFGLSKYSTCQASNIAPLWELESTRWKITEWKTKQRHSLERGIYFTNVYGDVRNLIYETEDKSMKTIQNVALYVLAFNCGIIAYWLREFKPIFNDFLTNHGAKNANGQRIGQPRTQISIFGLDKNIGLNRFIILVKFLSKILVPFVDSITGKFNQQNI